MTRNLIFSLVPHILRMWGSDVELRPSPTYKKAMWLAVGLALASFALIRLALRLDLVADSRLEPWSVDLAYGVLLIVGLLMMWFTPQLWSELRPVRRVNSELEGALEYSPMAFINGFARGFHTQRARLRSNINSNINDEVLEEV